MRREREKKGFKTVSGDKKQIHTERERAGPAMNRAINHRAVSREPLANQDLKFGGTDPETSVHVQNKSISLVPGIKS